MSKSPNKQPFVIIGNPENRRVTAFCETVRRLGHGETLVIPYIDWLTKPTAPQLPPNSIVKIDSPGENNTVRQLFIGEPVDEQFGFIGHTRSWYLGFCALLDIIHTQAAISQSRLLNDPPAIKRMFDKCSCHAWLKKQKIPVPPTIPAITSFEDLLEKMHTHHLQKVFIKPAHASSASGVIAFRKMGPHLEAISSIEIGADNKLYNSLTVRTYTRKDEVALLVDRIVKETVIIEEWLPKATLKDRYFDIRVLVIGKQARHIVLRTSRNIITNLHLGNRRGDLQDFIARYGQQRLREIKELAQRTAACFPYSFYMGVDILLTADGKKLFVLEVNAFGDLLPGLLDEGESCYEAEINSIMLKINNVGSHK